MAIFDSPNQVICELKKQKLRLSKLPPITPIYAIYSKFKETGTNWIKKSAEVIYWKRTNHKKL